MRALLFLTGVLIEVRSLKSGKQFPLQKRK
jgi:hypothetical protein